MAKLQWDETGRHFFETGVSNCVLYVAGADGTYPEGVAWSGVTKISQKPSGGDVSKYYADNIKYLSIRGVEEFGGTIEAYSYPDEFAQCNGEADLLPASGMFMKGFKSGARSGVTIGQQARKAFGLCYQTIVGNDTEGILYGKKIHIVYNATCSPSSADYSTMNESPDPSTMSWEFDTVPVNVTGYQPTSHIEIDCTKLASYQVAAIEEALYGKDATEEEEGLVPWLPNPTELLDIIQNAQPDPEPVPTQFKLSFNMKGVAVTEPAKFEPIVMNEHSIIAVPSTPVDSDSKKDFVEWYDDDGNIYDFDSEVYYLDDDLTLNAKWKDKPVLSFNLNGVTVTNPDNYASIMMNVGDAIAKPADPIDIEGNVDFLYWYDENDKQYHFDEETYYIQDALVLFANWDTRPVLAYDLGDVTPTEPDKFVPVKLHYGNEIPKPATPVDSTGKHGFKAWLDSVSGITYDFDNETYHIYHNDITLVASWDDMAVVKYDMHGVRVTDPDAFAPVSYIKGSELIAPPTPVDYDGIKTFAGWYIDNIMQDLTNYVVNADVTFRADWTINQCELSYDLGGVEVTNAAEFATKTVEAGSRLYPATPVPKDSTKIFSYWKSDKVERYYFDQNTYLVKEDLVVVAVWEDAEANANSRRNYRR